MATYSHMTVGDLITFLREQDPHATIRGLSDDAMSYRGYYEHVGIEPGETTVEALLTELERKVGTTMHGYKGGDFPFEDRCLVFVAYYGSTGDKLIGFDENLQAVTMEDTW